ncbi:MAG: ribonuclease [Oscillospiraceae bacterium]|nr:ribonuclease [Oscillospiraceae bacterium]
MIGKTKHNEVRYVKNAKRWLGYLVVAVIVILAAVQWLRNNNAEQLPQNDPAQQETTIPDDQGQTNPDESPSDTPTPDDPAQTLDENGTYTSKEDVALYLHIYGHLPNNFITKKDAEKLGWSGGSLEPYAPGMCIGGDRFGNYEGNLPTKSGRSYTECDIDTLGASSRGAKRIVFSNDGLIYYTEDHYNTFTLLYGEEAG